MPLEQYVSLSERLMWELTVFIVSLVSFIRNHKRWQSTAAVHKGGCGSLCCPASPRIASGVVTKPCRASETPADLWVMSATINRI